MNRKTLRSVAAIPLGWVVMVGGCIVTMTVIAAFNPESFSPGSPLSVGWLLVTLLVSFVCSVIGGFVTGVIAQRSEIKHAIGLVLFTLVISTYFMSRYDSTAQVPSWYVVAGQISVIPAIFLGGWLRMRQGSLLQRTPESVIRIINDLRLSIVVTIDHFRFPIAVVVSVITFVSVLYLGTLLGGIGQLGVQRLFGENYGYPVFVPAMAVSFLPSWILSRRVFRRIMAVDTPLMKGAKQKRQ